MPVQYPPGNTARIAHIQPSTPFEIFTRILAARRRQKWSVDPRNSAWSKDESKFGQKMLEKMGWSKGKGLGAQEQGNTEHIKVQVKNNTLGLGAAINSEDNWIAHQDDFNQLLAELNDCHGQGETGLQHRGPFTGM
ncbi:pin2 terf1-interacting telomerase inhibitor hypothetical protein [Limosa lapponica baueri]|uniref:G-patch domain-containing protein n=1 Tax=Limosa lapponica baueri TaxID=1758121 RepID=A0A2I0TV14_LIMLA|nr:pin2 terf1-interacting telomerase inhibitor hypothetical protein [Limosa lapponica baueri]